MNGNSATNKCKYKRLRSYSLSRAEPVYFASKALMDTQRDMW